MQPAHNNPHIGQSALEDLAAALDPGEHVTALITGEGHPPRLTVTSRRTLLTGDVYTSDRSYWWERAEPIGPVTDPAAAAGTVTGRLSWSRKPGHG